ncbi:MAG: NAD(P)H-dependent oxidoreductase [Cytophagales bacterium]
MKIAIISGSTRFGNNTHRVALNLEKALLQIGEVPLLLSLASYNFPIFEEVLGKHPNPPDGLEDFSNKIKEADAVLFVSPEYNGSYTSALKNALDYLKDKQFAKKAIGVVSVTTGPLGGMRGAMQMQLLVLGVHGYALPNMLLVPQVMQKFDENGNLLDVSFSKNINNFLTEFIWFAQAIFDKKNLVEQKF